MSSLYMELEKKVQYTMGIDFNVPFGLDKDEIFADEWYADHFMASMGSCVRLEVEEQALGRIAEEYKKEITDEPVTWFADETCLMEVHRGLNGTIIGYIYVPHDIEWELDDEHVEVVEIS